MGADAVRGGEEMTDRNIYIVYNGVRYRLIEGRDCTNHCSFRKADVPYYPYYCERGCYLPRWVKRLGISVDFCLERVDPNDDELRAENARLRAALKPILECKVMSAMTAEIEPGRSDYCASIIERSQRIYNSCNEREVET